MHFIWQVNVIRIIYCTKQAMSITAWMFCSRVCKERIKHNHISPIGLGRIDTHTQMHRHTHPTLEKVAIVAQMTHPIFFGSLIQDNLSEIPQDKKCS